MNKVSGLINALVAFMELMNKVFEEFLIMFINDILVCFKSEVEHEEHLRKVLTLLRTYQLYARFTKCEFWLQEVAFLGHVVSSQGITVDPAMIEAVMRRPRPKTVIEVRSFLGLASYDWRFAQDFSKISTSMTQLTKNGKPFVWTLACEESFQELKRRLVTAPVLTVLDGTGNLVVYSDASAKGLCRM